MTVHNNNLLLQLGCSSLSSYLPQFTYYTKYHTLHNFGHLVSVYWSHEAADSGVFHYPHFCAGNSIARWVSVLAAVEISTSCNMQLLM